MIFTFLLINSTTYAFDVDKEFGHWKLDNFKFIEVRNVYIDYMKYTWSVEPFLLPTMNPTHRIDLHVDMELLNGILYFENMIHSETDMYQYRLIGWNYRAGIHLGRHIDLYFEHFSQHLLDYVPTTANTYDAVGVRVYLYRIGD